MPRGSDLACPVLWPIQLWPIVMAYVVMAYVVMEYVVMVYVMAYILMASNASTIRSSMSCVCHASVSLHVLVHFLHAATSGHGSGSLPPVPHPCGRE